MLSLASGEIDEVAFATWLAGHTVATSPPKN
jgi:hypothetical protein